MEMFVSSAEEEVYYLLLNNKLTQKITNKSVYLWNICNPIWQTMTTGEMANYNSITMQSE